MLVRPPERHLSGTRVGWTAAAGAHDVASNHRQISLPCILLLPNTASFWGFGATFVGQFSRIFWPRLAKESKSAPKSSPDVRPGSPTCQRLSCSSHRAFVSNRMLTIFFRAGSLGRNADSGRYCGDDAAFGVGDRQKAA